MFDSRTKKLGYADLLSLSIQWTILNDISTLSSIRFLIWSYVRDTIVTKKNCFIGTITIKSEFKKSLVVSLKGLGDQEN
jgi:hypothetical protein